MSLVRSTATIGFFTLLSRISGFLRDVMMANLIGASWLSDAFFVAFKLPNFFRRLLAEGAFNAAFVPSFSHILADKGQKPALRFAGEVMSVLLVVLILLNVVFIVFMRPITPLFAPGFATTPEKFDLTVLLSQVTFPYILFISLVSLLSGVLNSLGRFAAPAANPILLNLCMVLGMIYLTPHFPTAAHALAWSVFVAGIVQFLWLMASCIRMGAMPKLVWPKMTPQVKKMLLLMAPAALGSGVQQLNLLVDVIIASHIPNAVSYLYYADRITELPIGMIGVAVGTALLPMLSRQIKAGELEASRNSMNRALEIVMLFGIPATGASIIIAEPIVRVLYMHGAFTETSMIATTLALIAFAAGLPAFLAVKIFAPGFYAAHDTKTPFKIAVLCVAINLFFNLTLIHPFKHVGMAMATTIASWVNLGLMSRILSKRGQFRPDALLKRRMRLMVAATFGMCVVLALSNHFVGALYRDGYVVRTATLCGVIVLGMSVYGVMVIALGAYDRAVLHKLFFMRRVSARSKG